MKIVEIPDMGCVRVYPFLASDGEITWDSVINVYPNTVRFDIGASPAYDHDDLIILIEALQTAAKIQAKLAAGEPVIIHEGKLLLPDYTLSLDEYIVLGAIASLKIDEGMTQSEFASWLYDTPRANPLENIITISRTLVSMKLVERDEFRHLWITDLGWEVLRVR